MPVTINGSGPITGLTSLASPTTLNGLTIPTTGFGKVLQVVIGTTSTAVTNNTTTYADTGLTAAITPSSTSSRILVIGSQTGCVKTSGNTNNNLNLKLVRNGTDTGLQIAALLYTDSAVQNRGATPIVWLDSPSTTSAVTYKTQFANGVNASGVLVNEGPSVSTLVLIEVA